MHLYSCYFWRVGKRTINGTTVINADAGPDLQYAENVRAALCWVALREKGINGACECVCVYVSVKLGLAVS